MRRSEIVSERPATPIAFGPRFAGSPTFASLFREGMALLEESAAYLDGPGRDLCRSLPRSDASAYASEAMRLTARLMQLASWLLLQRSANEGEISREDAEKERRRMRLPGDDAALDRLSATLPEGLRTIVERSLSLERRVRRIDAAIYSAEAAEPNANPVGREVERIRAAFGIAEARAPAA